LVCKAPSGVCVIGARNSPAARSRGCLASLLGTAARAVSGLGLLLCSDIDFYEDLVRKSRSEL
jgi:hypothetical protein